MPFFVYVLLNPQGETYVGQTADLERRLNQHNNPTCRLPLHTKHHPGPWRLLLRAVFVPISRHAPRKRARSNRGKKAFFTAAI